MERSSTTHWNGLAVVIGGVMWIYKATVILLGIADPGWMVIASQALLAFAVTGIGALIPSDRSPLVRTARLLAYAAMILTLSATAWGFALGDAPGPILRNVAIAAGSLALLIGLICIGLVARRSPIDPPMLRLLPLTLGVLYIPVLGAGAALVHEEAPIILLGLAWITLGALLVKGRPHPSVR